MGNSPPLSRISDDTLGFRGSDILLQAWRDGLRPDPLLTVSEWADRHRVLSSRASAEPGRYRTGRTPYLREIMDCLSPSHPCRRVVFMKGAQVGATEAGNNFLGFIIHHAPGPVLAVQPTVEMAKRNSRQRIDTLIDESPILRERVKPARSRDAGNTMLSKDFPGGTLVMTGANSAVGLRSMPARYLFLDEVDAYPASADEEGDPVALACARTRANVLLVTAGVGIVGGIGFMVFGHVDGNTAVGGCIISVVTLLAGKFATAFDFEFGGSADSEQTRSLLAQAPPIGK